MTTTFGHALLYATLFAVYVLGTLALKPRLWLRHYPPVEKVKQAALSKGERLVLVGHALCFVVGILLIVPVVSARLALGVDASRSAVFVHMLVLGVTASAVDWLLLDWLLIRWWQPAWLIPADTDPASWRARAQVIKDAAGFPIGAVIAALWGLLASALFF